MTQMCSRHFLFMYKYRWETTSTIDKIKWKNWNQDLSPKPAKKKSMIIQEQYSVRIKKKKECEYSIYDTTLFLLFIRSFIHSRSRNLSIYFRLFFSLYLYFHLLVHMDKLWWWWSHDNQRHTHTHTHTH